MQYIFADGANYVSLIIVREPRQVQQVARLSSRWTFIHKFYLNQVFSSIASLMSHRLFERAQAGKNAVKPMEVEDKDGNCVDAIDDAI